MSFGIDNASPEYNDYAVFDKDEKKPSNKLKLYVILGKFGSLTVCMVDVLNVGFDLNR